MPQEISISINYAKAPTESRCNIWDYENLEFEIPIDGAVTKFLHLNEDVQQLQEVVVEDELQHTEHSHNLATLNAKQLAESAGQNIG